MMNRDGEKILSMFPYAQCTQSQHYLLLLLLFVSATHMHPILVKKTAPKSPDFKDYYLLKIAIFKQQQDLFIFEIVIFRR